MEKQTVPLDLRPGTEVPIPCRHCGKALIRFVVNEGVHGVVCPKCAASTEVLVYVEGGTWQIKTARTGKPRPKN